MTLSVELDHQVGAFRLRTRFESGRGLSVLVGPSGAGKSLTLRMIAGIERPGRGRVVVGGETFVDTEAGSWTPPQQRRVGMVFQDSLLLPHRTVLDNVALAIRRGTRAQRRSEAHGWLEQVDAVDWAPRHPDQLSGGQAQRVALARALAGSPRLLILDEPFNALDPPVRHRMRLLLGDLVARWRVPTLFVTHDPAEAFLLADRIHVLEDGVVTQSGTAEEVSLRPRSRYAAELAGANLLMGHAADGRVDVAGHTLHLAEHDVAGDVLVAIRASAISLHRRRPEGSPRNSWSTVVESVERIGDRARVRTGAPLPLTVEITADAATELAVTGGAEVWVAVKATEVRVESSDGR
ncbi:MAG TPA: ABC transporter ATP-binding protein [Acidimicrobiia bacterium]|nr:ABC transporter ATP-binding protein [Acidimicrobiia bacterium]